MVKVELELPENVWRALYLVAEGFGETHDELAARAISSELEAEAEECFRNYAVDHFKALSEKILKLLRDEP